jgi:putative ABC transport system permease protein
VSAAGGSWNLFPLLGIHAVIGRTFTESEDRPDGNAVMLTWNLFERRFGGDSSILGRQIHLDGKPYTVVGVLPKWFTYPDAKMQVWVPYASGLPPGMLEHHDFHFSHVVARLRPDVNLASALGQVEAVQYQLHMQNLNAPVAEDVASKTLIQDLAQNVNKPLVILLCAVGCMLLIGCLNVANLMVARSAARQREIAIRSALGAQRVTLIREQVMESLLVSIAGGVTGVLLSLAATKSLVRTWRDLPSAEYPRRRRGAGVCLRARLCSGPAGRPAAGDLIDRQGSDRGAAGFVAEHGRQPIAYGIAQDAAYGRDCDNCCPVNCRRPSAQEFLAAEDDGCGLRDRQHTDDELQPSR